MSKSPPSGCALSRRKQVLKRKFRGSYGAPFLYPLPPAQTACMALLDLIGKELH